jgi:hypothetical protein
MRYAGILDAIYPPPHTQLVGVREVCYSHFLGFFLRIQMYLFRIQSLGSFRFRIRLGTRSGPENGQERKPDCYKVLLCSRSALTIQTFAHVCISHTVKNLFCISET